MTQPRIICAPDSFKGSISAAKAAEAMAAGARAALPDARIDICPIGDGGEGTLDALLRVLEADINIAEVTGPLRHPVKARWALLRDRAAALIELAEASGLTLVPHADRNPLATTTFGTGELIKRAINAGAEEIIIFIGGSATVDGGAGACQAVGARLFDAAGVELSNPLGGGDLIRIARVEAPDPPRVCRIRVACDVLNPLLGPSGAAAVYGPQKGATAEQVQALEAGLAHWAALLQTRGRAANGAGEVIATPLSPDAPGAGAAGGFGFGLASLFGAHLERGIDLVLDLIKFDERLAYADLVLTGEGRLDAQTLCGKAVMGIWTASTKRSVPVIALVGARDRSFEDARPEGDAPPAVVSLAERFGPERALGEPQRCLELAAADAVREWQSRAALQQSRGR